MSGPCGVLIARRGESEAWLLGQSEVYVAWSRPVAHDRSGVPMGLRWECQLGQWERYFETVHAPAGWVRESAGGAS